MKTHVERQSCSAEILFLHTIPFPDLQLKTRHSSDINYSHFYGASPIYRRFPIYLTQVKKH